MPRLRLRLIVVGLAFGGALTAILASPGSGSHGVQKWAGQWRYTHTSGPNTGLTGGFAFRHETDAYGAELLELIGGVSCPEPSDYFAGAYTVPDTEDLQPDQSYVDTGKFRACTVGDMEHLRGRYQSNYNSAVAGDFELVLDATNERWTGTFQPDGDQNEYMWTGFFQNHFDGDGANAISDPPYGQEPPEETETDGSGSPPPTSDDKSKCEDKQATITPNPDAPPGFAISGTAADDVIVGTDGTDRILGLGGNDIICGFGGDDVIVGGDGADSLHGGDGNDVLHAGSDPTLARRLGGQPASEYLYGEAGNDQLYGDSSPNWLEGGPGDDLLRGGEAKDRLYGGYYQGPGGYPESAVKGTDNDELVGGGGNDIMWGGRGNDKLNGGPGDETIRGGSGSDFLNGGPGTERLYGDKGNDRIDGGTGDEHKFGDLLGDVAYYYEATAAINVNLSNHRVRGGGGRDNLKNVEAVIGSNYDDVMRGSSGPDQLVGGAGGDDLYGLAGNDTLYGQSGDDLLIGGPGLDTGHASLGFDICATERRSGCERLRIGGPNT